MFFSILRIPQNYVFDAILGSSNQVVIVLGDISFKTDESLHLIPWIEASINPSKKNLSMPTKTACFS